ncbi:MAG TPA: 3-deoxy-D-manno-octulosonic acid transferase [Phycisphaerae bacterium]|nr:3-deoxy-D-manno-octulosonic acid transferase [Phycisphaerae bacterium]HNU45896.1 3-deoxy-D-manno-octulosonic acid transferase [Phycisphaerae bacterium]
MRWLADVLYLLGGLVYLPVAVYQALVHGKNRKGWGERFGGVPRFAPHRQRIWIHAVSLGETNATPRLVEALRERLPHGDIVFSSTTDTGYARAVRLYGTEGVFRFPLDFSLVIARVLDRVQPALVVLVEQEVWYNLTRMATRRGVPVAVVNGRLTDRSARRLRRLGPAGRAMFGDLAWVGAQDATIADRFRLVGVPAERIEVTSSMKWDTAELADQVAGSAALAAALGLAGSNPIWVCGSTGVGEEALLLEAYRRLRADWGGLARNVPGSGRGIPASMRPVLVIVPRKPERFDEVARLIEGAGLRCVRRSARPDGVRGDPVTAETVVLGDTMGELRKFYALADAVFVGRSLVPMGGSDPMEVAALGKPVLVGPYTDNFELPVTALSAGGGLAVVPDAGALAAAVGRLLMDPAQAATVGTRARRVVEAQQGATARTAEKLVELLDRRPG